MQLNDHKTICFDLDGTLCTNTSGDYEAAEPFPWAVERLNELARGGHRIIVFTARGTATGLDWEELTRAQLARWGVAYDELRLGKPNADVYVDDRAVQTLAWRWGDSSRVPGFDRTVTSGGDEVPGLGVPHLSAVVEVGRTFDGRPFRLERHVQRLRHMALAAGMGRIPSAHDIRRAAREALARGSADAEDVCFAISLSAAGHAAFADALEFPVEPGLHVARRPLRYAAAGLRDVVASADAEGVAAAIVDEGALPNAWPLFVDGHGHVSDALGGQIGTVNGRSVVLQRPSGPPTVAAEWLKELAEDLGVGLEERPLDREELQAAEEAFVLGLPFCILGLESLNGDPIWGREPGSVTALLLRAWSKGVGVDVAAQHASLMKQEGLAAMGGERAVG